MSIKNFLIGVVGLLVVILAVLSGSNVLQKYSERKEASRVELANELADNILEVTGFEARERGMTAMVLSSDKPADSSIVSMINDVRAKGDEEFKKAKEKADLLLEMDGTNRPFREAVERAKETHSALEGVRRTVDGNFALTQKTYPAKDWIKVATTAIEASADMRMAAFGSTKSRQTLQEALRMNLELKQAIWLVSEYAGRERATVAPFVNTRKPFDQASLEKLNTFRAVVDINLKPILRLKSAENVDAEVMGSVSELERVFIDKFGATRTAIYAAGSTGEYPLTSKEWIDKSTEGINTVIALSARVGAMVDKRVMHDLSVSSRNMATSLVVLVLVLLIGMSSIVVIKSKVISSMGHLNTMIADIEKTGDLTMNIEVRSGDESGQMAANFNNMINKFHDIIKEIHITTETLASSSEELSASASQIADGSQSQGAKATQVSTAAQEMSATIIEVGKNVASAADAAREASLVAMKGGEIVTETIDSMNGISETAKESSDIIATLGGRSQEIGKIINVIEDIADQTNLLALNAAIEAARAGEQGRGFAVVADEVRKLAEKTMKATKEIGAMIKAMQDETDKAITSMNNEVKAVESGVKLAMDAGSALKDIVSKVDVVSTMVTQITTASEQQAAATEQISGDIESVANVITETTGSSEQIARASQEIASLAAKLKGTVEIFRINPARQNAAGNARIKDERSRNVVRLERQIANLT